MTEELGANTMKDKTWNKDKLQELGTSEMEQDAKIEKEQQDIADRTFERLAKHAVSPHCLPLLAQSKNSCTRGATS